MTRLTPREFRKRVLQLQADIRRELVVNDGQSNAPALLQRCLDVFDELEDPLTRFVMTSDKGMRT